MSPWLWRSGWGCERVPLRWGGRVQPQEHLLAGMLKGGCTYRGLLEHCLAAPVRLPWRTTCSARYGIHIKSGPLAARKPSTHGCRCVHTVRLAASCRAAHTLATSLLCLPCKWASFIPLQGWRGSESGGAGYPFLRHTVVQACACASYIWACTKERCTANSQNACCRHIPLQNQAQHMRS